MHSALYLCNVMHQRLDPFQYRFNYHVVSLKIDIDHFKSEVNKLRWLSLNQFNLMSIYTRDFGGRGAEDLRTWANDMFRDYGIKQPPHRIELVCTPRILGLAFNPLAIWYGYNNKNQLIGIIAEVSNTFGQWHHYVLAANGNALTDSDSLKAVANKEFHVSPFIGMDSYYQFRFSPPSENYQIHIKQYEHNKPTLIATQAGNKQPLTNKNIFKFFIRFPFHALKVMGLIHWWALKIWIKGGQFRTTPKHLKNLKNSHSEMMSCSK